MKKTQWIELWYNIRHTMVSFVAVVLFVALATGLFTGIRWTGSSLDASVEAAYAAGRHDHFELSYPYGFDRAFLASLTESGAVDEAEGYYETYRNFRLGDDRFQAKIVSLTESIDRPACIEGTLPTQAGEAAVNAYWAQKNGVRIGDVLTAETGNGSFGFLLNAILEEDVFSLAAAGETGELTAASFRVTALVEAAAYMGKYSDTNGMSPVSAAPVAAVFYVAEDSFDERAFCGYPRVAVRTEKLDGLLTNSDAYAEKSDELESNIAALAQAYAEAKNASLRDAAERMERTLEALPMGGGIGIPDIPAQTVGTASRQMNASFAGLCSVMDTFDRMQYSLVSLFVIIGILVCYSTVSRLVYDQTVLIGTKKAVGFFPKDIRKPFLIYSALAVITGTVCGVLLGRFVIEPVMVSSVRDTYRFGQTIPYFGVRDALLFSLLQAILILATAFLASTGVSKKPPLTLLTGASSASASTHDRLDWLPLWSRASLMRKTIIRNCLNDGRRVFATLIGVMGCTALVVCALSMYDNLTGSFTRNMEKVSRYDTVVYFSGDGETKEKLSAHMEKTGVTYAPAYYSLGAVGDNVCGLYVPEDAEFYELLHLYDEADGREKQAERGAWVNAGYAENFGVSVGDTACFTDALGQKHELPIEGVFEYYLINHQFVLPKALYEAEFGTAYSANTFLLRTDGADPETLRADLTMLEDGLSVSDFYNGKKSTFDSMAVIARAVVAVYLLLSFVLAVLLLLNLFTMFVNEKKRELITLMINGFDRKAVEKYITGDTRVLTTLGILLGVVLGIIMGGISLDSFNNSATHFLNRVDWKACVVGALFTAALTHLMCRIALRRVRTFRLSDINSM